MTRARSRTASSIGGVSRPVNVFCWLGWYVPTSVYGPIVGLGAVGEPGLRARRRRGRAAASALSAASQPMAPSATMTRSSASSSISRTRYGRQVACSVDRRLVGRRGAADGGRDSHAVERQAVIGAAAHRAVREADLVHRPPQEVARGVAGEHAPGPVAAVRGRREADEQDLRARVAEARHRPAPVRLVAEARDLDPRLLLAPRDQARTGEAVRDRRRRASGGRGPQRAARAGIGVWHVGMLPAAKRRGPRDATFRQRSRLATATRDGMATTGGLIRVLAWLLAVSLAAASLLYARGSSSTCVAGTSRHLPDNTGLVDILSPQGDHLRQIMGGRSRLEPALRPRLPRRGADRAAPRQPRPTG